MRFRARGWRALGFKALGFKVSGFRVLGFKALARWGFRAYRVKGLELKQRPRHCVKTSASIRHGT